MKESHQTLTTPWHWPLCGATLLPAADDGRWLVVKAGNVWLTRSEGTPGLSDDIWLTAGQRQRLPAGSEWVIEAWPQAQLELLLAPPRPTGLTDAASPTGDAGHAWQRALQRVAQHLRRRAAPGAARPRAGLIPLH